MKLMLAAASIAAIVATVTPASAETALDWQTECHSAWANRNASPTNAALMGACMAYTAGVADALVTTGRLCMPPNVSLQQIRIMVHDYTQQHPERLNMSMAAIIKYALVPVWPCH